MAEISVIVPVYNAERFLDKCLNSIVNQTFKDIEIIIVNDGSVDNSGAIIDKYAKDYSNIKAFKIENRGPGGARNYGLEHATGKYIGFIDADDWISLNMYEELYKKAIETKADIVTCFLNYRMGFLKIKCKDYKVKDERSKENVVGLTPFPVNLIFKKKLLGDLRFPNQKFLEDFPVICYLYAKANKIVQINKFLYNYRFNLKSNVVSNVLRVNMKWYDMFLAIDRLKENFSNIKDKDYHLEIERMVIVQIFFRLMFLPFCINLKRKEKRYIYNLLISYLDVSYPKWQDNKYYKSKIGYLLIFRLCLALSKKLYFIKNRDIDKNEEEIKQEIYEFLKKKECK